MMQSINRSTQKYANQGEDCPDQRVVAVRNTAKSIKYANLQKNLVMPPRDGFSGNAASHAHFLQKHIKKHRKASFTGIGIAAKFAQRHEAAPLAQALS